MLRRRPLTEDRPALRAKSREAGCEANLECARGGFLSYSPAGSADGVYTRNALHQVPDFWKVTALRRIAGLLRQAATEPAAGYTAADYAEHIRTEHSTFRWLLEPMLAATGFEIADVSFERRIYGAYTCVKTGNG